MIGLSFSPVTHAEFAKVSGATSTSITQGGTTINKQSPFTPMTDLNNVDYTPFLDHSVSNPWAYPGSRP